MCRQSVVRFITAIMGLLGICLVTATVAEQTHSVVSRNTAGIAKDISGTASVIDGDTLDIHG